MKLVNALCRFVEVADNKRHGTRPSAATRRMG
jgi:hypothetical protein